MNILAYWCNGDKEQMLRIFATSGLFRPNKSADYYEHTAIKALREIPVKSTYTPTIPKNNGGNGKEIKSIEKATASSRSQKKNYFNKSNKYPSSDLCFPWVRWYSVIAEVKRSMRS